MHHTMELSKISVSPMPAIEIDTKVEIRAAAAQYSPAQQLFFRQLHKMLEYESSNANSCVKWLHDSKGFAITDKDAFSESILKRHFGEAKYASFTRRLKRWGFRRITKGADSGAYYHDAFHRGMTFDEYEDDMGSMSPSESSQSLPPKKRMAWSPVPGYEPSGYNAFDSMRNRNADVNFMPEIMREINRSKQRESSDYDFPAAKRAKYDNGCFSDQKTAASMPRSYAYSSFGNYRSQDAPQDQKLDYLSKLKRQVYEENQGAFNMDYSSSNGNFRNSMNTLSDVSTDILKREIELRRMQQRLAYQNKCRQMYHQSPFNGYSNTNMSNNMNMSSNMNMSNMKMMHNGSKDSSSMRYFNGRTPQEEYAARALGSLKGPSDISGMPYMHKKSSNQMNGFDGSTSMSNKNHGFNYSLESGSNKVPIPGIDELEQKKNPFNRAA